jgi:hypothetical protein
MSSAFVSGLFSKVTDTVKEKAGNMGSGLLSKVTDTVKEKTGDMGSGLLSKVKDAVGIAEPPEPVPSSGTGVSNTAIMIGVGILLIALFVGGFYLYHYLKAKNHTATVNTLNTAVSKVEPISAAVPTTSGSSGSEGFQMPTIPPQDISPDESTFINLQPMAIKDAGFEGPYPNGSFNAATATANVLKSGFRFLTLQIDYMDSAKTGFGAAGEPTMVIRGENGSLLSKNSGSIKDVAETIANMAFRPEIPHNIEPVILYLHILRTPSALKDPNGYMQFLSKIATALNPIAPMHLGLNPTGNFTRQKMADTLLTTPLKSLQGQVIVLCNADTSLFRNKATSLKKYNPNEDLDFLVNMRVFLDGNDSLGITQLPEDPSIISAVVVNLDRVLHMTSAEKEAFAAKGKRRYVIAMPPRLKNPSVEQLSTAINTLGINVVPVDIFTNDTSSVLDLMSEYANMPYHPKPVVLRNMS